MANFVEVAKVSDIPDQNGKCVEVEGEKVALFNLGGKFFALEDTCPHQGGPLSEGDLVGDEIACPWHGAQFKLSSGEVTCPPAESGVKKYNVRINGDAIEIEI